MGKESMLAGDGGEVLVATTFSVLSASHFI